MSTTIPDRSPSFPPGLLVCPLIVDLVLRLITFSMVHRKSVVAFDPAWLLKRSHDILDRPEGLVLIVRTDVHIILPDPVVLR